MLRYLMDDIDKDIEAKKNANDPYKAGQDSLAASSERVAQGIGSEVDYNRLMIAGRIKTPTEDKPTDRASALQRIRSGIGDKADSIYVDLLPPAAQPRQPDKPKTAREILDEKKANALLGGDAAGYKALLPPETPDKPVAPAKTYQADVSAISRIQKDLEDYDADSDAGKALNRELGIHETNMKRIEQSGAKEITSSFPPDKHAGKRIQDNATGIIYQSDGKKWNAVPQ